MYSHYFGLKETPFSISPDPRYLFMSERHREALAHLLYGVGEGGGFVLLTGEVGTGKTTICRCLLEQLPANTRLAYILNPKLNAIELLATMCDELGIRYPQGESSLKVFTDLLRDRLLDNHRQGLNTVLMIDEAQNLSVEVLEQIRLLTNLETNKKKLLQIILIGQPELQELLARKELRQLAQRITARYHLRPLSLAETETYICHRLQIAGVNQPLFSRKALRLIHKSSQGVPRLINVICDRALMGAYSRNRNQVDVPILKPAVAEVLGMPEETIIDDHKPSGVRRFAGAAALMLLGAGLVYAYQYWHLPESRPITEAASGPEKNDAGKTKGELSDSLIAPAAADNLSGSIAETGPEPEPAEPESAAMIGEVLPVEPETLEQTLLGGEFVDRYGDAANTSLLALWGVDYNPDRDGSGCDHARQYGLQCLTGSEEHWRRIEQFNRPVNLKFASESRGVFWGTLKAIEDDEFVLQFGRREVRIDRERVLPLWQGDYQLVWKTPPGYVSELNIGAAGQPVVWLSRTLTDLYGEDLSTGTYDARLKTRVRRFQRGAYLVPDGIAGAQTLIMLNTRVLPDVPRLVTGKDV